MDLTSSLPPVQGAVGGGNAAARTEQVLNNLSALSTQLERELSPADTSQTPLDWLSRSPYQLEMAKSLFNSLQSKHGKTASHSARVLLGCAGWSNHLRLSTSDADAIQMAALLHDVGKICVPDSILLKPTELSSEEHAVMSRCRQIGLELVRNCLANPEVLDLMQNTPAWFDGSRTGGLGRDQIPLGARMLSIMDAFDSMTTDQVYRPAHTPTRALDELHRCAGKQFDPELVRLFADASVTDPKQLQDQAEHWLHSLAPTAGGVLAPAADHQAGAGLAADMFQYSLLENISAAVVFVNTQGRVLYWNRGAERLTGLPGQRTRGQRWATELIQMRTDRGLPLREADCPIAAANGGITIERRYQIRNGLGREVAVDVQAMPVRSADGVIHGAILLAEDASSAVTLEARCRNLNEMATKDALTQVANRAEFDRRLAQACHDFEQHGSAFSLVICDVDHFKKVNDTFGHQAGDEVLKGFARLLEGACRGVDHVARYGGEEFVLLFPGCDLTNGQRRANDLRRELAAIPQPALNDKLVTASFGVTEIVAGDVPTEVLRRADVALYAAKGRGRNVVVALAAGDSLAGGDSDAPAARKKDDRLIVLQQTLSGRVPLQLLLQKLKGFITDCGAEVLLADGQRVELQFGGGGGFFRRRNDFPVPLVMELTFPKDDAKAQQQRGDETIVDVTVRLSSARERRRDLANELARDVLRKLRMYLVLTEVQGH